MKPQFNKKHTPNRVAEASARTAIEPFIDRKLNRQERRALNVGPETTVAQALLQPPKDNKVWDDVNMQSASCHRMLSTPGALLPVIRAPEIQEIIKEQGKEELLDRTSTVLARDLVEFTGFYKGIRQTHEDRKGPSTDPDDHLRAITTFNDYAAYTDQFNANVMPMVEQLGEIAAGAETVLRERNPQAADRIQGEVQQYLQDRGLVVRIVESPEPALTPEQDPNVVTDVTVN